MSTHALRSDEREALQSKRPTAGPDDVREMLGSLLLSALMLVKSQVALDKPAKSKRAAPALSEEDFAERLAVLLADVTHEEARILRINLTAALTRVTAFGINEANTELAAKILSVPNRVPSTAAVREGGEELTTEEGAALLFVSRPYFVKLVDSGKIPLAHKTEGGQRRVKKADVLAYRANMKSRQARALDEMSEASQRLNLYAAPPYKKTKRKER